MTAKLRVFIADDSALVREWLCRVLDKIGGAEMVGHAKNIFEVPHAINSLRPDLIVFDLHMGKAEIEILKQIKKIAMRPLLIVFANRPSAYYKKRYLEAGADYFFDRSVEQKELAQKLKELVNNNQEHMS